MVKIFLRYIFVLVSIQLGAANYYWVGGNEITDWSVAGNWKTGTTAATSVPATTLPTTTDAVFIETSALSAPKLPSAITIASLTMTSGKSLDLNGYDLAIEEGAVSLIGSAIINSLNAGKTVTVKNCINFNSTGHTMGSGTQSVDFVFNGKAGLSAAPIFVLGSSVFWGECTVANNSAYNITIIGGNTYKKKMELINNSSASIISGNTTAEVFDKDVEVKNLSTGRIYLAYGPVETTFKGDIYLSNTNSLGQIWIGNNTNLNSKSVLEDGKKLLLGTPGLTDGTVIIWNFEQKGGNTPQSLITSNTHVCFFWTR